MRIGLLLLLAASAQAATDYVKRLEFRFEPDVTSEQFVARGPGYLYFALPHRDITDSAFGRNPDAF